jgi:hypothetical protein
VLVFSIRCLPPPPCFSCCSLFLGRFLFYWKGDSVFVPWMLQAQKGFGSYSGVLPQRQSILPSFLLPLTFCSHSLDFLGRIHFRDQPLFLFAYFSHRFCWISVCYRTQDQGSVFSPDLLRQLQRARSTGRFPLNFSSDLYDSFWFLFFLIKHHVLWSSTQVNPCCCCLLGLCESRFLFSFCSFWSSIQVNPCCCWLLGLCESQFTR